MRFPLRALVPCLVVVLSACGSSEAASLCGELHDPSGEFCNSEFLDLRTAEARARLEAGDDALLVWLISSPLGLTDPDGFSEAWHFVYSLPSDAEQGEGRVIVVTADEVTVGDSDVRGCDRTASIAPLDSLTVIPDAVRRLEETDNPVRLGETGTLGFLQQHPCFGLAAPAQNAVSFGQFGTLAILEYDDDGNFVSFVVQ